MNDTSRTPKLLDRCDVALDAVAREKLRLVAPQSRLLRNDSALRAHGAHGVAQVSLNRVPPAKRATMEQRRFRNRLCGAVRCNALQNRFRQAMGNQGTGARGHIFSTQIGRFK